MSNYQIDRVKWAELSLFEQMGNIGSEVGRSVSAYERHDQQRFNGALARAIDLFDATIDVMIAQRSARVREVLIAKDQFLSLFFGNFSLAEAKEIEKYFMQYAIAARLHR